MRNIRFAFVGAFLCLNTNAFADSRAICEAKDWQSLARSLEKDGPKVSILSAKKELRRAEAEAAQLRPESTANAQFTAGGRRRTTGTLEASYLFSLEDSEKLQSRIAAAASQEGILSLEKDDLRAKQILELGLIQENARRILYLRDILLETEETYRTIIQLYQRIPSRGPEQETSLAVFQIARGENDFKIEALELEQKEFQAKLSFLSGCDVLDLNWKKIPALRLEDRLPSSSPSTAEALLEAERAGNESRLLAEQKQYLPDFSLGPVVLVEKDEDQDRLEFGLALSYPLGSTKAKQLGSARAKEAVLDRLEFDRNKRQLQLQKTVWLEQYESARRALKKGMNPQQIAQKHRQLEKLFRSDRVSAALVIEAHRQMFDHVNRYAELEFKAVEAGWNLRYLNGELSWRDL